MDLASSVYGLPTVDLLERIERALSNIASILETGMGSDPMIFLYRKEVDYLEGAVLAKKENKKPPFLHGTRVVAKSDKIKALNSSAQKRFPNFPVSVMRVYYNGDDRWLIEIDGLSNSGELYNAEDFEISEL